MVWERLFLSEKIFLAEAIRIGLGVVSRARVFRRTIRVKVMGRPIAVRFRVKREKRLFFEDR